MIKALVLKELRESAGLIALAVLGALYALADLAGLHIVPWSAAGGGFPFVNDQLTFYLSCVAGGLAIALGVKQSAWELRHGSYYFLLHRPVARKRIFSTKLAVGAALTLCLALSIVFLYALWANTPGTRPTPFFWSMTSTAWQHCVSLILVYLGAFLAGIRPGSWFGTRLAPLVASAAIVLVADVMPWWWVWLAIVLATGACQIASIVYYIEQRDF
jgi:ABC-type transport system involved in multi-copper enzyme maturation permease subunit